VQTARPTRTQQIPKELRLSKRFATGKCHATTRLSVKHFVFQQLGHYLAGAHPSANDPARTSRACFNASAAHFASVSQDRCGFALGGAFAKRANNSAFATANAACFDQHQLRQRRLSLRIMTPATAQRTTLQKDRRPNTRAVLYRVPLDVKHDTTLHLCISTAVGCSLPVALPSAQL